MLENLVLLLDTEENDNVMQITFLRLARNSTDVTVVCSPLFVVFYW